MESPVVEQGFGLFGSLEDAVVLNDVVQLPTRRDRGPTHKGASVDRILPACRAELLSCRPSDGDAVQHSVDTDVLVEVRPTDSFAATENLEVFTLLCRCFGKAPRPAQRDADCPAIAQLGGDHVLGN